MADINLKMSKWNIVPTTPPIHLGYSGENNAITINIQIEQDEVFNFADVKYYLDIMDKIDGNTTFTTSQELTLKTEIIDEQTVYTLTMQPTKEWLGQTNLKYLQVRCKYTDDTDSENPKEVVIKSNAFEGIVKLGL